LPFSLADVSHNIARAVLWARLRDQEAALFELLRDLSEVTPVRVERFVVAD